MSLCLSPLKSRSKKKCIQGIKKPRLAKRREGTGDLFGIHMVSLPPYNAGILCVLACRVRASRVEEEGPKPKI